MSPRTIRRNMRQPGELNASDRWRTPQDLFQALDDEFGFVLDLAADAADHLCPAWLGPGGPTDNTWGEDALAVDCDWQRAACAIADDIAGDWPVGPPRLVWTWLNPPYSAALIKRFMEKVVAATRTGRLGVVTLTSDDHSTVWYQALRQAAEIRRIPHRVPYLKADGVTTAGAMFPSCVGVFRPQPGVLNPTPRIVDWTWRP